MPANFEWSIQDTTKDLKDGEFRLGRAAAYVYFVQVVQNYSECENTKLTTT